MRLFSVTVLAAGLLCGASVLHAQAATTVCKDGTTSTATGRGACSSHGGVDTKATQAAAKAASTRTATVTCTDGSTSKAGRGACSYHGGVKASGGATTPAAAATAPAATSRSASGDNDANGATAKCKDGTYSHAKTHRGACSRHGGVAEWLTK